MAFSHLKWFEFATTSINTHSYIFTVCVFSIPLQAHLQKQRKAGKQQFEALPQCLSLSHSGS